MDGVFTSGNISRQEIIRIYEWLLTTGKILKGGAAHKRLKDLKHRLTKVIWR